MPVKRKHFKPSLAKKFINYEAISLRQALDTLVLVSAINVVAACKLMTRPENFNTITLTPHYVVPKELLKNIYSSKNLADIKLLQTQFSDVSVSPLKLPQASYLSSYSDLKISGTQQLQEGETFLEIALSNDFSATSSLALLEENFSKELDSEQFFDVSLMEADKDKDDYLMVIGKYTDLNHEVKDSGKIKIIWNIASQSAESAISYSNNNEDWDREQESFHYLDIKGAHSNQKIGELTPNIINLDTEDSGSDLLIRSNLNEGELYIIWDFQTYDNEKKNIFLGMDNNTYRMLTVKGEIENKAIKFQDLDGDGRLDIIISANIEEGKIDNENDYCITYVVWGSSFTDGLFKGIGKVIDLDNLDGDASLITYNLGSNIENDYYFEDIGSQSGLGRHDGLRDVIGTNPITENSLYPVWFNVEGESYANNSPDIFLESSQMSNILHDYINYDPLDPSYVVYDINGDNIKDALSVHPMWKGYYAWFGDGGKLDRELLHGEPDAIVDYI